MRSPTAPPPDHLTVVTFLQRSTHPALEPNYSPNHPPRPRPPQILSPHRLPPNHQARSRRTVFSVGQITYLSLWQTALPTQTPPTWFNNRPSMIPLCYIVSDTHIPKREKTADGRKRRENVGDTENKSGQILTTRSSPSQSIYHIYRDLRPTNLAIPPFMGYFS